MMCSGTCIEHCFKWRWPGAFRWRDEGVDVGPGCFLMDSKFGDFCAQSLPEWGGSAGIVSEQFYTTAGCFKQSTLISVRNGVTGRVVTLNVALVPVALWSWFVSKIMIFWETWPSVSELPWQPEACLRRGASKVAAAVPEEDCTAQASVVLV